MAKQCKKESDIVRHLSVAVQSVNVPQVLYITVNTTITVTSL